MRKNILVISFFAILLMIPPLTMIAIGWHWSVDSQMKSMKWMLWLTDTAGAPYSIITSIILLAVTLYVFRIDKSQLIKLVAILIICLIAQQGLKVLIKNHFQQPRPYIVWLENNHQILATDFYQLKRPQRAQLIQTTVNQTESIPKWQLQHWQSETGYSFPSGHMLFAAGWALLLIGLFWQRRQYTLSIILAIWAEGIAFSRMLLGMHWPIDVIVSIIISAIFAIIGYGLFNANLLPKKAD